MLDETYLLNEIKEAVSFVSPAFSTDLERTWKGGVSDRRQLDPSIVLDYVLPNYEHSAQGFARPHDPVKARRKLLQPLDGPREDILPVGNERFAVPELLFTPSDIGLQEAGLPEAIMQSMSVLPRALQAGMLANVVVVGGNSLISGFMERLWVPHSISLFSPYLPFLSDFNSACKTKRLMCAFVLGRPTSAN
jgi:actin-related protein 6